MGLVVRMLGQGVEGVGQMGRLAEPQRQPQHHPLAHPAHHRFGQRCGIGGFDTAGAKVVLTVNVDDYAEAWIDGVMPRAAGRPSLSAVARASVLEVSGLGLRVQLMTSAFMTP